MTSLAMIGAIASSIQIGTSYPNLAAYWNLVSDGNAAVGTPNLTAGTSVSFSSGIYAALDGSTNATLTGVDTADISIGNAAFTWAGWVYLASNSSTYFLLNKGRVNTPVNYANAIFEYILFYNGSRFQWILYDTAVGAPSSSSVVANTFGLPTANTWYYVTAYYKPGMTNNTIGISVNLGSFDTQATSLAHADTAQNLTLGYRSDDNTNFSGRMKQWGFWKEEPANIDLAYFYNGGSGRSL